MNDESGSEINAGKMRQRLIVVTSPSLIHKNSLPEIMTI
jgi:hypothetical protein